MKFYTTIEDIAPIFDFIYSVNGEVCEDNSDVNSTIKHFNNTDSIIEYLNTRQTAFETLAINLPSFNQKVKINKIEYKDGSTKEEIKGWAFILLNIDLTYRHKTKILPSNINNNSQKRALNWYQSEEEKIEIGNINWSEVEKLSRQIKNIIKKNSVTKINDINALAGAKNLYDKKYIFEVNS